jgi:GNAT superfamily N-acetyltransferase
MTADDVVAASEAQLAAFEDLDRRLHEEPMPAPDAAAWERIRRRHHHFLEHDPGGSWVAEVDGTIVGCALALKRESLWGLSLLVVDPSTQSSGVGRQLLDASLTYAAGCERAIILSSPDRRAMRAYATSGFALYPQVGGKGEPDRTALPALNGRVRDGSLDDVALADDVDRAVRGAPRGPDHVRMASDMPLFIVDDVDGKGYAYIRGDGELYCLAATDDDTASALLWRCCAHAVELGKPIGIWDMTAEQQWAIDIAFAARLKMQPVGPVFWRGITPPRSFLPSGAYL